MRAIRWLIPIFGGLATGWMIAHFALPDRPAPPGHPPAAAGPPAHSIPDRLRDAAPPPPVPASIAEVITAGNPPDLSPFRSELIRGGAIEHLPLRALETALADGTLTDELEVARAFARLASSDPIGALELHSSIAIRLGRSGSRRAYQTIWESWVEADPSAALAHLESLPPSAAAGEAARHFAHAWAAEDPAAAMAHLVEHPRFGGSVYGRDLLSETFGQWVADDPDAAGAWVEREAPADRLPALRDQLTLEVLKSRSSAEAIDYLIALPPTDQGRNHLRSTWRSWALGSPDAAFAKLATLPPDHPFWHEADDLAAWAQHGSPDPEGALAWAARMPEGTPRQMFLKGLVNHGASNNIAFALEVLPALPECRQREEAVGMLTELWARENPVAVSEWLASLPPSPSRDRGVSRFSTLIAPDDPARAADWAATIESPEARASALDDAITAWQKSDPAAATAWLEAHAHQDSPPE
ncbi:hypothetical protein BH23VER1_BH23VER1_00690 [soil metagenome]